MAQKKPQATLNILDRAIGFFSPRTLVNRTKARMTMSNLYGNGYAVPGSPGRPMKGVTATPNSPNNDTLPKVSGSRAISRDLFMRSPVAAGAVKTAKTNIVGAGLRMQSRIDREYLGLDDEDADNWERNTERQWRLWSGSRFADHAGVMNFGEMQGLALLSVLLNGDTFYMLPWKKPHRAPGWPWKLRIKLIEADLVRDPYYTGIYSSLDEQQGFPGGVEKNKSGEVVAYHVAKKYPQDGYLSKEDFHRIPIRATNGRTNIHQLMDFTRIDQVRGMPFLAPVVNALQMITSLSEAELTSAVVSSMFTVFVKDMSGIGGTLQQPFAPADTLTGGGGFGPDAPQEIKDTGEEFELEMGNAAVTYLDDDKEIQIADPKKTDANFAPFYRAIVEEIGSGIEIPAEQILKVFNTSYSAARAAILEACKLYDAKRTWLVDGFCQPTYEAFLEESILIGRIVAKGFFDDPAIKAAWAGSAWRGKGTGQLDPLKETRASVLKVQNNLSTLEDEAQVTGQSWDDLIVRRKREEDRLKKLGLDSGFEEAPQTPTIEDTKDGEDK